MVDKKVDKITQTHQGRSSYNIEVCLLTYKCTFSHNFSNFRSIRKCHKNFKKYCNANMLSIRIDPDLFPGSGSFSRIRIFFPDPDLFPGSGSFSRIRFNLKHMLHPVQVYTAENMQNNDTRKSTTLTRRINQSWHCYELTSKKTADPDPDRYQNGNSNTDRHKTIQMQIL